MLSDEEIEKFWKHRLILSMRTAAPDFMVDGSNCQLLSEIYQWVWHKSDVLSGKKGILLYGPVGSGKTTILKGLQDLFVRTEFISIEYVRNLVPVMIREGLIQRKVVKRGLFRLTINK